MSILKSISNLVKQWIPTELRGEGYEQVEDMLQSMVSPMQAVVDDFEALEKRAKYLIGIQFETQYIVTFLNDEFDNVLRRIFIETNAGVDFEWMFQRAENRTNGKMYTRWKSTTSYVVDDRVVRFGKLYKCLTTSTNQAPETNSFIWQNLGSINKEVQRFEFSPEYSFTVWLPSVINSTSLQNSIVKSLKKYVPAGNNYNFNTF